MGGDYVTDSSALTGTSSCLRGGINRLETPILALQARWSDAGKDEIAKNISVRQPNQF